MLFFSLRLHQKWFFLSVLGSRNKRVKKDLFCVNTMGKSKKKHKRDSSNGSSLTSSLSSASSTKSDKEKKRRSRHRSKRPKKSKSSIKSVSNTPPLSYNQQPMVQNHQPNVHPGSIIPEFNPNITEIKNWLEVIDFNANMYDWSDQTIIFHALNNLRGTAKLWYDSFI